MTQLYGSSVETWLFPPRQSSLVTWVSWWPIKPRLPQWGQVVRVRVIIQYLFTINFSVKALVHWANRFLWLCKTDWGRSAPVWWTEHIKNRLKGPDCGGRHQPNRSISDQQKGKKKTKPKKETKGKKRKKKKKVIF